MDRIRRPRDPFATAEDVTGKQPSKPAVPPPARTPATPGVQQSITLQVDEDILDHYQAEGPGWKSRMVAVLRAAAGLS